MTADEDVVIKKEIKKTARFIFSMLCGYELGAARLISVNNRWLGGTGTESEKGTAERQAALFGIIAFS